MAGYGKAVYCPICGKALNKISDKSGFYCWNCETEVIIYNGRLRAYKYTDLGNTEKILDIEYEYQKKAEKKKENPKIVVQYEKGTMREINRFDNIREASKKTGANESGISQCLNNRYKQSGGFVWRYADV